MNARNRRIATTAAIISFLLTGCGIATPDAQEEAILHVHVQAYFDNEQVRVELNDELIFNQRVRSTRAGHTEVIQTGEPAFVELAVAPGVQQLRLWVEGVLRGDTTFAVQDTLWVGLGRHYDRPEVIINMRSEPMTYL